MMRMSRKVGRPKLEKYVRFTVTTTEEVKEKLQAQADRNDRSLAREAGRVLAEALGLEPEPLAENRPDR